MTPTMLMMAVLRVLYIGSVTSGGLSLVVDGICLNFDSRFFFFLCAGYKASIKTHRIALGWLFVTENVILGDSVWVIFLISGRVK